MFIGVVLVGMGCEQISAEKVYQGVLTFEKPLELFIEAEETIEHAGERLLQEMLSLASGKKQLIFEKGTYEEPMLIQIEGPSL
jgi:altronate dehydratase